MPETIAIASDHGGYALKQELIKVVEAEGRQVVDLGPHSEEAVDYPDYGYAMAHALKDGTANRGVLLCGSGIGISIAANRFPHVRAALVHDALTASLARLHNQANVLCMGGRTTGVDVAKDCLKIFLNTEPEDAERHERRVKKLTNPA